jgi:ABC-type nitrate/sulfonate/bicarbonate transport system substrate-binding protein
MKPYEHYLPLDIDYHNLAELVDWAKSHPVEAQAIADNAARYVNDEISNSDMECYALRLGVEFNRVRRRWKGKEKEDN